MKTYLLSITVAAALLQGCCHHPHMAQGTCYVHSSGQSIVNNTAYRLDVFQDGNQIAHDLGTGQVLPIRSGLFAPRTSVVVTGHTDTGEYVGSDTYIFQYNVPEAWSVNRLYTPKSPQ